jgi:glucokinase
VDDQDHSQAPDIAVGVEAAQAATRYAVTLGGVAQQQTWQARLHAPPTPEEAILTIERLLTRALGAGENESRGRLLPQLSVCVAFDGGQIERATGLVRSLRYAVGWQDVPFGARLEERIGGSVRLVTTTEAAATAEARIGAGRGLSPLLYVAIGRTLSCSTVLEGRAIPGAHDAEGQLGHWVVGRDSPRCSCGARGHLEPLASAQALVRNLIGRAAATDEGTVAMLRASGGRAEAMTAPQVVELAASGDASARAVLEEALDALAPALANLCGVLDPAAVVIGGPLAMAGQAFFAPLDERLRALRDSFTSGVPALLPGALGLHAVVLGASLLAAERPGLS